ncbi:MAG: sodium:solute symporter family protein [bacterium]
MHWIDFGLIAIYLIGILLVGLLGPKARSGSAVDYIIGGRRLTLPAFVATLVSTWYGGILGVGEFTFRYGISNWLVFGIPYYIAALLFAFLLARKARRTLFLTIPDRLNECYGRHVAGFGAVVLFIVTVPAAYVLILGILAEQYLGLPFAIGVIVGTIFSVAYLLMGGFSSVVRTDLVQMVLMYLGFGVLFVVLVSGYGGLDFLRANVPTTHFTWHGGNSGWYIAVWYVLALATLIEPTFYQRCFAARSESVARRGIIISVGFWLVFDLLTTACGLYARALLPSTTDPVAAFPALAQQVLPVGLNGLFAVALLATVMSTIDSYSFIAASTLGKDIICGWFRQSESRITYYTRIGLIVTAVSAVLLALYLDSVVDIWHHFGSVATPVLLVPLVSTFVGRRRLSAGLTMISMLLSGIIALFWLLSANWTDSGSYWLGLEPVFPGLALSLLLYFWRAAPVTRAIT